ncbi:isopentenyl-diphosphate Delta-isomerase [Dehalobacter sp. DCM]|uniref:isopentenyl-diphosphate Delta-isomerase n=1 Tax=Dehalobacter sp. DCM TaxID=2907827 RepID=UPI003081B306|nr:isopentenyl-diphosphate Delta-isomerase [Dehalobacter sp. DCM]
MQETVILVDEQDREVGIMEKMEAHRQGLRHRAFSIFVFNDKHELLIHKRAATKYHSEDLWTNTCCSHPRPGEDLMSAATRRLMEEMGFTCPLKEIFVFQYTVALDKEMTENEIDHVFIGEYNRDPVPNPDEVSDYQWIRLDQLADQVRKKPEEYTYWFAIALKRVIRYFS